MSQLSSRDQLPFGRQFILREQKRLPVYSCPYCPIHFYNHGPSYHLSYTLHLFTKPWLSHYFRWWSMYCTFFVHSTDVDTRTGYLEYLICEHIIIVILKTRYPTFLHRSPGWRTLILNTFSCSETQIFLDHEPNSEETVKIIKNLFLERANKT